MVGEFLRTVILCDDRLSCEKRERNQVAEGDLPKLVIIPMPSNELSRFFASVTTVNEV